MKEFINKHPWLTGIIVFQVCKTIIKVAKIVKGTPIEGVSIVVNEAPCCEKCCEEPEPETIEELTKPKKPKKV